MYFQLSNSILSLLEPPPPPSCNDKGLYTRYLPQDHPGCGDFGFPDVQAGFLKSGRLKPSATVTLLTVPKDQAGHDTRKTLTDLRP